MNEDFCEGCLYEHGSSGRCGGCVGGNRWLSVHGDYGDIPSQFRESFLDPTPEYYNHTYKGIKLDVYRVQLIQGITHPIQQHMHKKISRIHKENHKDVKQTLNEIKQCCDRWLEILQEDEETK